MRRTPSANTSQLTLPGDLWCKGSGESTLPHGRVLTRDADIGKYLAEVLGVKPDVEKYLLSNQGKPDQVDTFHLSYEQFDGVYYRPPDEVAAQIFADR